MTRRAPGSFEVKLLPQLPGEAEEPTVGRLLIKKIFSGDLDATSKGQMLAFRSEIAGSAGYVAVEHVRGSLHGRTGSFVLQHSGTMNRGEGGLVVTVVPDSGTGELVGLAGTMTIEIVDGKHLYGFEYVIVGSP